MLNKKNIEWENVKICPLCASHKFSVFLSKIRYFENDIDFTLVKCRRCHFIFINPRPVKKSIGKFYKKESYWGVDTKSDEKISGRDELFAPIDQYIDEDRKSRIFDLGSGTGLFLTKYKRLNWTINGVEFSKDAVNYAKRNFKIDINSGDFLDLKMDETKYDYVVINNVLEHLYDPLRTLIKVNKILQGDGKLIVAVPNIDGYGFKIFKRNWYPLQPPIHLNQFTPDSITKMLNLSGFEIIKIDHKYPVHSKFGLFESYRSLITKRNQTTAPKSPSKSNNELSHGDRSSIVKKIGVSFGHLFATVVSNLGYLTGRGENIIVSAQKKDLTPTSSRR